MTGNAKLLSDNCINWAGFTLDNESETEICRWGELSGRFNANFMLNGLAYKHSIQMGNLSQSKTLYSRFAPSLSVRPSIRPVL